MNPIVSFAQADQQFQQAKQAGAVAPDVNLQGFAQMMSQITGNPEYQQFADDSWLGTQIKRGSAALDRGVEWTGLPEIAGDAGYKVAEWMGMEKPEEVQQMVRGLPRAAANMAPMMLVPGPGWAGAAAMGATALLSGADAYEKTDDLGSAALAGATPWAATKLFGLGGQAAMKGMSKLPGMKALGFEGGEAVVSKAVANGVETTSEQLFAKTLQDRVSHYVGGQAAAGGAFFAKDVIEQGEKAFTPEFLLGTVLNQAGFLPFDVAGLVKPHAVGKAKITGERNIEKSEIESEPTPAQKAKTDYMVEKAQNPSALNDMLLKRKYGLDIAESFANESRLRAIQEVVKNEKEALDDSFKGTVNRLKQEGFWPENLTVDALIEKPELGNEFVQTAVKEYKDKLAEIEKNAKDTVTPLDTLSLFGVAVEELGLDPAGRFVQTPLAARDAKLFREQFQGKLTEQQIGDAWLRHQAEKGDLPPDMTQFPGYKPNPPEAKKVKNTRKSAVKKVPVEKQQVVKEVLKKEDEIPSFTDETISRIAGLVRMTKAGEDVREVLKGTAFEPLLAPERQVEFDAMMIKLSEKMTDSKEWNAEKQVFDDISVPPVEQVLNLASQEKVKIGEVTSIADRSMWLSTHLVEGGTLGEGFEAGQNKVEAKVRTAPVNKINRTPEEAKAAEARAAAELKLQTREELDQQSEVTIAEAKARLAANVAKVLSKKSGVAYDVKAEAEAMADATKAIISDITTIVMEKIKQLFRKHVTLRVDKTLVEQLRNAAFYEVMPANDPTTPRMTPDQIEEILGEFGLDTDNTFFLIESRMEREGMTSSDKGRTVTMTDVQRSRERWSMAFAKEFSKQNLKVIGEQGFYPTGTEETRANIDYKVVQNLSQAQYTNAQKIAAMRSGNAGVPQALLREGLRLDVNDPGYTYLMNELSQSMSLFESTEQFNTIIDGARQYLALFQPDKSGNLGVDAYITKAQKRQGMSMHASADLHARLTSTFYNWMHKPSHWFKDPQKRVGLDAVSYFDGNGQPVTPQVQALIDAAVNKKFAAHSELMSKKGKSKKDGKLPRKDAAMVIEEQLAKIDPTLSYSMKPGTLMLPLERAAGLTQAFKTTIRNYTKAEYDPVTLNIGGKEVSFVTEYNPRQELLAVQKKELSEAEKAERALMSEEELIAIKEQDKQAEIENKRMDKLVPETTDTTYPEELIRLLATKKETEPMEVYTVSERPRKRTTTKELFLKKLEATPGVTKEQLEAAKADPTSWKGVSIVDKKVVFYEWNILKARIPNLTSVDSLVARDETEVIDRTADEAQAKFIYDADVQNGIKIFKKLAKGDKVDPDGDIQLISDLLNQSVNGELDRDQRVILYDGLMEVDAFRSKQILDRLKLDPKVKENILATYNGLRTLKDISKMSSREFFTNESKLNAEGEQIAQMMTEWGLGQNEITLILKDATPEIKYALLNANRKGSDLDVLRRDLNIVTRYNVDQQVSKHTRGGVMARNLRDSMISLADLVAGRTDKPVEFGGMIYYTKKSGPLTPYGHYIATGIPRLFVKPRGPLNAPGGKVKTEVSYEKGTYTPGELSTGYASKYLKQLDSTPFVSLMEGKMEFSRENINKFEDELRLPSSGKKVTDNYPFLDRLINAEKELLDMRQRGLTKKDIEYRIVQRNLDAMRRSAKALDEQYSLIEQTRNIKEISENFERFYQKFLAEEADGISFAATTPLRAALRGAESRVDRIISPDILAEHIFDDLGIPFENRESYTRDFVRLLELSRVEGVGFGRLIDDINAGVLGGAVGNKREIYLSNLKQLAMGDRVKSQHFVLAHELGHIIEADARSGRYGPVAQEAYAKADSWIRSADTQTLADAMDVLYNGLLPEEFRNSASLEVSKNLSPEEFFANASAFHRLSLLKDGNEMVNTLLPTPLRSAFDWLVGHFHRLTKGLKMFNGARRKFEAHQLNTNLLKSLEKIRLSNRKAEENNDTGYRMLIASSGDLAQIRTSSMEFVDASVENAPGGKEWVDLARGNFGKAGRHLSRWLERGEDLARRHKFVAPLMAMMRDAPSAVTAGVTSSMTPILGESHVNGVRVEDKEWSRIANSSRQTEALRVVEQTANMEGVNPVVEDPVTGVLKLDQKLLTASGRAAFNKLSPMEKANVEGYMLQRVTSMKANTKLLINAEHDTAMFEVSTLLDALPSYKGRFHDATADGHAFYAALKDGALPEVYRMGSKMSDADFAAVLQFAQKRLDGVKTRKKAFDANPFHLTFRRFGDVIAKFKHPTKGDKQLSFDTRAEVDAMKKKLALDGYELVPGSVVEQKGRHRMGIDENGREWQVIRQKENEMKMMVENLGIDAETKSTILNSLNFTETLTKNLASESYGFGAGRKFTEGFEKQNPLHQHLMYVEMTQRMAHSRLLRAGLQHHFRAPEFLEHPEIKQQMEEALENFMTPDNAVGAALNKANAVMFIGMNLPSHISEFMQPINTLLPEWRAMGGKYYEGVKLIGKFTKELTNVYRKAFGASFKGRDSGSFDATHFARHFKDPDHVALITEAEKRGRFNYGHLAETSDRLGEQHEKIRKVMSGAKNSTVDIAIKPFHWFARTSMGLYGKFTQHNELMGLMMGYESAKARGMSKQEAIEEALNFSTAVNKSGGRGARQVAPWAKDKMIGHIFYALQSYTTGYFSQLSRYYLHGYTDHPGVTPKNRQDARKALRAMVLAQVASAGVLGLPFMGAMLQLMEEFTGEDIKGNMFKALDEVTNDPNITDMAANGVANHIFKAAGMPIDVHSRFAMGGMMGFNEYDGFSPGSLMGPTGSMVEGLWNMGKTLYQEQNFVKAFREGGPVALKKMLEMYENDGRIMAGGKTLKQLEGIEKFTYGMGFQNAEVSKLRSAARMVKNASERDSAAMGAAANRLEKVMRAGPAIAKNALRAEAEKLVPVSVQGRERQMMLDQTIKSLVEKVAANEVQKNSPADFRQGANARVAAAVKPTLSAMGTPIPQSSKLQQLQGADAVFAMFGMPKVRNASTYRNAAMLDQMRQQDPLMFQSEAQY
jgi:hypothetical protein